MTPHNTAEKGQIASTCLMPGDPLRAKMIAENFLTDVECFNQTRGMLGYTGNYQGKRVSVMGHGMGIPSIGIYTYELFSFYDVENIIRIGSAGAMTERLKLRDVVAAQAACTNSNYIAQFDMPGTFAPIADFELLETAVAIAREKGVRMPVGNVLSSDNFYDASGKTMDWAKMGVLCAEMESAALYANAAYLGKRALSLLTISDSIVTGEELPAADRQTTFTQMMEIALGVAVAMAKKEG